MKTMDDPGGASRRCEETPRQLGAAFAMGDAVCAPYYVDCGGADPVRPTPGVPANVKGDNHELGLRASGGQRR